MELLRFIFAILLYQSVSACLQHRPIFVLNGDSWKRASQIRYPDMHPQRIQNTPKCGVETKVGLALTTYPRVRSLVLKD